MKIQCKDGEREIPPDWIKAWNDVHLNVQEKLIQLQGYCRDDGKRVPKKVGLRRFLGSIIRKDCPIRETVRQVRIVHEDKPKVSRETIGSFVEQMKEAVK